MQATDSPQGRKRLLIRSWTALLLFLLLVEALPTFFGWQARLRADLDTLIDGLGLWQGQWELFGPEPDKINVDLVADIEFDDGKVVHWRTPDPQSFNFWQKLRYFRWMEYTDGVRLDANHSAWAGLADYLLHSIKHPSGQAIAAKRVLLWRYFVVL